MKKFIATADDFGVYPCINAGVIEAVKNDKVNSVAVLTNYKDSVKNVNQLLEETEGKSIDIGCHLTITSGAPLTGTDAVSMCANDHFRSYTEFRRDIDVTALRNELNAQIDVLEAVLNDHGKKVMHLTCHHNSLTLFKEHFDIYLEIASKRKLPLRSPNTLPVNKNRNYLRFLRFKLIDDLRRSDRRDIKRFGEEIYTYFRTHPSGAKAPDILESRHYGPLPGMDLGERRMEKRAERKRRMLDELFNECVGNAGYNTMELMLHLAKGDLDTIKDPQDVVYPGIDLEYFDSRLVEFNSIMSYPFSVQGIEKKSWADACPYS